MLKGMQNGKNVIKVITLMIIVLLFNGCDKDPKEVDPEVKEDAFLTLDFTSSFNGETVDFDQNSFVTGAKDTITPSTFKFIFSKIRMVKMDDTEITFDNRFGYVDLKSGDNKIVLPEVPAGDYKAIRFYIGLDSAENFGDPSQWASDHPLNPNLTGLHWGWAGGYIFMTNEGTYKNNGTKGSYTFHIATIPFGNEISIDLPYSHTSGVNETIAINADLGKYFDGVHSFSLKNDISGSHSKDPAHTPYISNLTENIQQMFSASIQ